MWNKDIIIRPIDKDNKRDLAFISVLCRNFGTKLQLDFHDLSSDKAINSIVNKESLRIITLKDEYLGFAWLDNFKYNLRADIHGFINQIDKHGKLTKKYYLIFLRNRVMEQVLEHYFKFYNQHVQLNIETINAEIPDYLQNKFINGALKIQPTAKLLTDAGFTLLTGKPLRNHYRKNGKPCASFLYQIQKKWLLDWLEIEREHIAIGLAVTELAKKFKKKPESITERIERKKLNKKEK